MTISTLVRWQLGEVSLAVDVHPGSGAPTLFVHGSWDDHRTWDDVRVELGGRAHLAYDRRGHSASTTVPGQGTILQDADDAVGVIEALGHGPVHVVGHSYGACIALVLTARRPDLVRSLVLHEPPLFGLLVGHHEGLRLDAQRKMRRAVELAGDGLIEEATIHFVEQVAFGAGSWMRIFSAQHRATMLANIDTWIDQSRDPQRLAVDVSALRDFGGRITLTTGTTTLPTFAAVTSIIGDVVPAAVIVPIDGAGHGAPVSHPRPLATAILEHLDAEER